MCYNVAMENQKKHWSSEKAQIHLKISSLLIIGGGIAGLIMAVDDFTTLGTRTSAFILPYSYNIIAICISFFQIYLGIVWQEKKIWAKYTVFAIIAARFIMSYYDIAESWQAIVLLLYILYIIPARKMGKLFQNQKY
jgi:hypothetical protein